MQIKILSAWIKSISLQAADRLKITPFMHCCEQNSRLRRKRTQKAIPPALMTFQLIRCQTFDPFNKVSFKKKKSLPKIGDKVDTAERLRGLGGRGGERGDQEEEMREISSRAQTLTTSWHCWKNCVGRWDGVMHTGCRCSEDWWNNTAGAARQVNKRQNLTCWSQTGSEAQTWCECVFFVFFLNMNTFRLIT